MNIKLIIVVVVALAIAAAAVTIYTSGSGQGANKASTTSIPSTIANQRHNPNSCNVTMASPGSTYNITCSTTGITNITIYGGEFVSSNILFVSGPILKEVLIGHTCENSSAINNPPGTYVIEGRTGVAGGGNCGAAMINITSSGREYPGNSTSNTSTASTTVTPQASTTISSCLSSLPTISITNGNFGTGTYYGWNVIGFGSSGVPANITKMNAEHAYYGTPWAGLSGNYFATTYNQAGGLALSTGNLTSDAFTVSEPYLNFQIISKYDQNLYVEILEGGTPVITAHYDTYVNANNYTQSTFKNVSIPLTPVLCRSISIRVVADVLSSPSTNYDYIAVGDFYLSNSESHSSGVDATLNYST